MRLLNSIAAAIVSALLFATSNAHSQQRDPITYLSPVDDARIHTPSNRAHAASEFSLTFSIRHGRERIKLVLSPNHNILGDGATVSYMAADGSLTHQEPLERSEYRVFKGHAMVQHGSEWFNVGWARVIVHEDGAEPMFEGAFRVEGNHHHIQTAVHYNQTKHPLDPVAKDMGKDYMVVWRDSDITTGLSEDLEGVLHGEMKRETGQSPSCSADGLSFNSQPDHPVFRAMRKRDDTHFGSISTRSILERQNDIQLGGNSAGVNLAATVGQTNGCPTTRRVALVGVATDCTYTAGFNSTESVRRNIIQVINAASTQYEDSFNITLGLQNLTISDANCPATPQAAAPWNIACSDSVRIQDRLNLFSAWRGARPDNNAYWTLLSTCATGSAVGLAWLGQACVVTTQVASSDGVNETVSGANVVVRTNTEWQVVAHETGHTFGAVHDCDASACASGNTVASQQCCPLNAQTCNAGSAFIMNPSTGPNISKFSPCTIGNVCSAMGRNSVRTNCLTANKDITTITGSQCGNGIVESGEDCDCGGPSGCSGNPCCNPTTCEFNTNAVCDPSNEDCCSAQCQFQGSGVVCRASSGTCDPAETCSGTSATCPADVSSPDGQSCATNGTTLTGLVCTSGQCTSRDLQCKTLMGSYTQGNDTYACSHSGCQISCASPEFGSNVCYSMQQNFLDGTSCQGGGKCSNGECQGASVGKEIKSWIDDNRTLVIALASVIGGLIVIAILSCCISRCRRGRRVKPAKHQKPLQQNSWNGSGDGGGHWNQGHSRRLPSGDPNGNWGPDGRWRPPPQPTWQPQPTVRYA
ncbi:ADAM family of metalloprotease-like protein ADM-B [Amylocarpus encephaloides]|uniref:Disintegrin and metalloproteinase domain-containing protein B n=1 Tax=Amylocarpus encephaloides TaxID=45428 RepID=A0A9P7YHW6_9HELO|nr:ADAM family of metalloprotease-like protein ADM-B [Amylocarpus encephaloides]